MFIWQRKTSTLLVTSGAAWIHVGTFSVHELHGKGHKMPRACERRHSNKGAGGQVALAVLLVRCEFSGQWSGRNWALGESCAMLQWKMRYLWHRQFDQNIPHWAQWVMTRACSYYIIKHRESSIIYYFFILSSRSPRGQVFSKGAFNEGKHFHCRASCHCDQLHAPIWIPDANTTVGPTQTRITRHVPNNCPLFPTFLCMSPD